MWRQFKIAIIFLVVFTVITGVIYPLVVTGIAQAFFHKQANGSLIVFERKYRRFLANRAAVQRPEVFLGTAVRNITGAV